MVNLLERAQKKKKLVLAVSLGLVSLFFVEIYFIFSEYDNQALSLGIAGLGMLGVLTLQVSYLLERKFLVRAVIKNLVEKKTQKVNRVILNKLLKEDFSAYLRGAHVFTPRDVDNRSELNRVEGLSSFVEKYRTYADLNLLDEFSKEILSKNKTIRISYRELSVDVVLFAVPLLLVTLPIFKGIPVLVAVLSSMRFFTCAYYFKQYVDSRKEKFSTEKIGHFLYGDFESESTFASIVKLDVLKDAESASVFFLADAPRKEELEVLIRFQTSGNRAFKDWSVISVENSVYKNKVKSNKAFILYPSDMLFPFEEMQEFISAFDKVIIVDSSPSYALPETEVFYLDHDQQIKKVHVEKNMDRLSGDKGLILRNFRKNNLDLFLTHIEKRIISKEPVYLVYENAHEKVSCEQNFVYPSGVKMVSILNGSAEAVIQKDPAFCCDLSFGTHKEKLERAKSFVANCSYHKIYSGVMMRKKLKDSFRAS